jgi:hypothetical protein
MRFAIVLQVLGMVAVAVGLGLWFAPLGVVVGGLEVLLVGAMLEREVAHARTPS